MRKSSVEQFNDFPSHSIRGFPGGYPQGWEVNFFTNSITLIKNQID
jgi:hypothetical protein